MTDYAAEVERTRIQYVNLLDEIIVLERSLKAQKLKALFAFRVYEEAQALDKIHTDISGRDHRAVVMQPGLVSHYFVGGVKLEPEMRVSVWMGEDTDYDAIIIDKYGPDLVGMFVDIAGRLVNVHDCKGMKILPEDTPS
jgi:hypothetical protein